MPLTSNFDESGINLFGDAKARTNLIYFLARKFVPVFAKFLICDSRIRFYGGPFYKWLLNGFIKLSRGDYMVAKCIFEFRNFESFFEQLICLENIDN